ncbi:Serine/threonine-protein phosphatase 6 regulatory ankyrin repeat subunit C [Geodia barretti]|uniref:Serine/threonine-protein phosphatase 6 regulatory ankyrin repeat subunit C n=2 Tax=Geodia barretti TaxID=519541 RepID=A0AA35RYI0_GEOBA|nr:Serine/threonine-protein phosphatase 6 regulatory ankyrin repeat subunit C [Geodia barretti]
MASTQLSPLEIVDALDELTIEKTKELFFHLSVQLKTLDDIDTNTTGEMRKIRYVKAWFDQEAGASWEKIVAGLKKIGMTALANTLATRQYLGGTPTPASVIMTPGPDHLSSPVTAAPEAGGPEPIGSSPSEPALGPLARPSSPTDRVSQVRAEIDRLSDTFSDLMSDTRDEMCTRESIDPRFLDKFRDRLLDLPVAKRAPHTKFFHERLDEFLKAENTRKIFAIIRCYSSYRNYAVLREVVRKFCQGSLQQRMQEYCDSLEKFEKATMVDVYLEAIEASDVLSSEFTKMTVKINKPVSQCTLHEIRKTTEAIAERASLQSYSVYIGPVLEGSVVLQLGLPVSCVGWILGALTPDFLATHLLSDVVLGQDMIFTIDKPLEILNGELWDACRSGDVITAASLLNSGADIEALYWDSGTPLLFAIMKDKIQVIRLLISRGADLNLGNGSPLKWAASVGVDALKELVQEGASLDLQDERGDSAVFYAVRRQKPDVLRELVRAGSNVNLLNEEGLTPLIYATMTGSSVMANILLEGKHIDLDIQENVGRWSALHFSAENGDSATTYALIKAGANVDLKAKNGWTAIEMAEVKSADQETALRPELSLGYRHRYNGPRDYGKVIELLRGNLVEPVTPTSQHVMTFRSYS